MREGEVPLNLSGTQTGLSAISAEEATSCPGAEPRCEDASTEVATTPLIGVCKTHLLGPVAALSIARGVPKRHNVHDERHPVYSQA